MTLVLHGYRFSVYCWIVRFLMAEKALSCEWREIDPFALTRPEAHADLHPFARVPVLVHDGFALYETGPILRYLDEAFPGPALQPADPRRRARLNQIIAIADAYAYWPLVRQVFSHAVFRPAAGEPTVAAEMTAGMKAAPRVLKALDALASGEPFLLGQTLTLADIHLAPMLASFAMAPQGIRMLQGYEKLDRWLSRVSGRPTFAATRPDLPGKGEA